jgi:putative polyhydroxyalkanoate system protein
MWNFLTQYELAAVVLIGAASATGWAGQAPDRVEPVYSRFASAVSVTSVREERVPEATPEVTGSASRDSALRLGVRRRHHLGTEGARQATDQMIAALCREQGVRLETRWTGSVLHARGRGFQGTLRVSDDDIEIELRLSPLLLPLRGAISREAEVYLARYIGPAAAAQ